MSLMFFSSFSHRSVNTRSFSSSLQKILTIFCFSNILLSSSLKMRVKGLFCTASKQSILSSQTFTKHTRTPSRFISFSSADNEGAFPVTKVLIRSSEQKIDHLAPVHFIGSCFTDTISKFLDNYKFDSFSNAQGILFNPISISRCLDNILKCKVFQEEDIFKDLNNVDTYHSWNHHSSYSSLSVSSMIDNMNKDMISAHNHIIKSKILFLTLGTARVHKLKSSNEIVSNCHKQPSHLFEKKLLATSEIVTNLTEVFKACKELNPDIQIVLTVSPVRHTKEGMAENSLSKSTLICAVHELVGELSSFVSYFPSYENFIDELRDYRWYGEDLIHPSVASQKMIFQRFSDCFMSEKASKAMGHIDALQADMNHRPSEALKNSLAYHRHLETSLKKVTKLQYEYKGYLNFDKEENLIKDRLLGISVPP